MRAATAPSREICQSELPLRAHSDPKPATSAEGSGTATPSAVGEGVGDDGEGDELDVVGCVEVVAEVDAVVHAASSSATEARYVVDLIRFRSGRSAGLLSNDRAKMVTVRA